MMTLLLLMMMMMMMLVMMVMMNTMMMTMMMMTTMMTSSGKALATSVKALARPWQGSGKALAGCGREDECGGSERGD